MFMYIWTKKLYLQGFPAWFLFSIFTLKALVKQPWCETDTSSWRPLKHLASIFCLPLLSLSSLTQSPLHLLLICLFFLIFPVFLPPQTQALFLCSCRYTCAIILFSSAPLRYYSCCSSRWSPAKPATCEWIWSIAEFVEIKNKNVEKMLQIQFSVFTVFLDQIMVLYINKNIEKLQAIHFCT